MAKYGRTVYNKVARSGSQPPSPDSPGPLGRYVPVPTSLVQADRRPKRKRSRQKQHPNYL